MAPTWAGLGLLQMELHLANFTVGRRKTYSSFGEKSDLSVIKCVGATSRLKKAISFSQRPAK